MQWAEGVNLLMERRVSLWKQSQTAVILEREGVAHNFLHRGNICSPDRGKTLPFQCTSGLEVLDISVLISITHTQEVIIACPSVSRFSLNLTLLGARKG